MERLLGTRQAMSRRAPGWAVLCALAGAAIAWSAPTIACINTYSSEVMRLIRERDDAGLAKITRQLEERYAKAPTVETTNDLAVAWILTGRNAEGIQLLRDLDQRQPGNALVAANLGTALELSGNDEEALTWIRESVRRDPQEHRGSEWVHVKILEARLALKRDPAWLRKNSVIGWREGQRMPLDERSQPRTPRKLVEAIHYQLAERLRFVEAPDPIVADLYLTLGDLAHSVPGAHANAPQRDAAASSAYKSALEFGTVHAERARERMQAAEQRIEGALPARVAAEKRDQEARARELEKQRTAGERRAQMEAEQRRRRLMPFIGLAVLTLAVAGFLFWRRQRPQPDR